MHARRVSQSLELEIITRAVRSHASITVCVLVCVFLILFVRPHDKTKTAETTVTKLATAIGHHESSPTN